MHKMRFDVKCVKECLVKNKIVYTVRSWEGYSVISNVEVDGVGPCTKKRIMRVTGKEDLVKYLSLSGFSSLDNWWAKIRSFGACGGWLFEVRVISNRDKASVTELFMYMLSMANWTSSFSSCIFSYLPGS